MKLSRQSIEITGARSLKDWNMTCQNSEYTCQTVNMEMIRGHVSYQLKTGWLDAIRLRADLSKLTITHGHQGIGINHQASAKINGANLFHPLGKSN